MSATARSKDVQLAGAPSLPPVAPHPVAKAGAARSLYRPVAANHPDVNSHPAAASPQDAASLRRAISVAADVPAVVVAAMAATSSPSRHCTRTTGLECIPRG